MFSRTETKADECPESLTENNKWEDSEHMEQAIPVWHAGAKTVP